MPSFTVHALFPLLLLLAIPGIARRKTWALWPLAVLPDLDYFFGFHRATLGNVFILVPFAAGVAYAWWRPGGPDLGLLEWMGIAMAYLGAHLLMDVLTGGSVLLYPFSDYTFCVDARILVVTETNTIQPVFEPCSREGIPQVAEVYPWLSAVDSAILAVVLPVALAAAATSAWQWWRARRTSA